MKKNAHHDLVTPLDSLFHGDLTPSPLPLSGAAKNTQNSEVFVCDRGLTSLSDRLCFAIQLTSGTEKTWQDIYQKSQSWPKGGAEMSIILTKSQQSHVLIVWLGGLI